jgi:nicotinamide mononucleotide transporter
MTFLFDVNSIMWTIPWFNYPMSWAEFIGTVSGLWCVWLTAKEKVLSWPVGLVNVIFFFAVFWQVRLYSDVLLQTYFFATGVYGWWKWMHPSEEVSRLEHSMKVTMYNGRTHYIMALSIVSLSLLMGFIAARVHLFLPSLFPAPAAYPYWDSVVAVTSIFAQWLLTKKRLEAWVLWLTVDAIAMFIYYQKGIKLISMEYVIFFFIAAYGFVSWYRSWKKDGRLILDWNKEDDLLDDQLTF